MSDSNVKLIYELKIMAVDLCFQVCFKVKRKQRKHNSRIMVDNKACKLEKHWLGLEQTT